ncbi:MAG: sugar transferase [Eubacterium sp.]|nr:sugar transferase [Eubacterium sp.]
MRIMHWQFRQVYRSTQMVLLVLAVFVVVLLPLHKNILKRGPLHELAESLKYVSILAVGIMLYHFLTQRGTMFSRGIFLIFWVAAVFVIWLVRTIYKVLLKRVFLKRAVLPELVLVTCSERAADNYKNLEKYGKNRYRISGALIMEADGSFISGKNRAGKDPAVSAQTQSPGQHDRSAGEPAQTFGIPDEMIIGDFSAFGDYFLNHPVDEVYIDLDQQKLENKLAKDLITQGITVHIALTKQFRGLPNQELETFGGRSVMTSAVQSVSAGKLMIKRLMDIIGAVLGLVLTGIAFLVFAPVICHQSKGPVFYSQIRIGLNGRRFRIYKFRSMYPDADQQKAALQKESKMQGLMFNVDNDPRIIPIGRFMRKYSIDELPQFWNVLKGDMSLVGTRPPTEDEWKQYSPHHRARLSVKPGLTGMWQTSGRSDIVDFERVVELDMKYIREWSLKLDCKLLLRTIRVVFGGQGSK